MNKHYILLRPITDKEKEKNFRCGYLLPYPLLEGLELVDDTGSPHAYQKINDTRKNIRLVSFKAELPI